MPPLNLSPHDSSPPTQKHPLTSPVTPTPGPARPTLTTTDTNPRDRKWAANLAAAKQFYEREGHLNVPRKHVETVLAEEGWELQFRLGAWVSNQRSRAATLSEDRREQLSSIGMRWS
ncbi:helicase associated domain-containing protein [Streptomyces sp. NPDC015345]|uniref:helicase associated domain-containing protein n=1 Tax=Streptomyces sp. NPDC015345 TaxID=3364953 RepID=UPI0036FEB896